MKTQSTGPKAAVWTGRILSILCILFLLFDAIMKVIKEQHAIDGSAKLGWPADTLPGLGIVLLICTLLYAIPRTALIGAVLLTGYLGGAVAIMIRAGEPMMFPVIFGVLVWAGLLLRAPHLLRLLREA